MCGICGAIDFKGAPIDKEIVRSMNSVLFHRGPDDEGYHFGTSSGGKLPYVSFGMRRLSIIDLHTGQQPIHNEDKSIWLVLNGEIYNYRDLTAELKARGHVFYTNSDTEVLAHLYEEYGIGLLDKINGMFAFALWDKSSGKLFLVRDRIGKKPLYYTVIGNRLYFASEIKSFLAVKEFKGRIRKESIHYFLTYQYIPSPYTIYQDVYRLMPASYMQVDKNGMYDPIRYWSLSFSYKTGMPFNECCENLMELLTKSVKDRMISDVPLGAFLSGGIDSSIVVGLMSSISSAPVKTFSVGFEDQEFSELKYAKVVAEKFGCDHTEIILKPDYADIIPKITWYYDQPFGDSSSLPSYLIAGTTAERIKVVLVGDGGDENFAGYRRYSGLLLSEIISRPFNILPERFIGIIAGMLPEVSYNPRNILSFSKRFLSAMTSKAERRNIIWHCIFDNSLKDSIYSAGMRAFIGQTDAFRYLVDMFKYAPAHDIIDRAQYTDINAYLPEDLLVKMDIACMANSLEARSPFLDYRLMEFSAMIPSGWKIRGLLSGKQKYILKEAFKYLLPSMILNRPKQGFGIPVGKWFRSQWQGLFREMVLSKKAIDRGYFERCSLERLFNEHIKGIRDHGYRLWSLLMLESWHRVFVDRENIESFRR